MRTRGSLSEKPSCDLRLGLLGASSGSWDSISLSPLLSPSLSLFQVYYHLTQAVGKLSACRRRNLGSSVAMSGRHEFVLSGCFEMTDPLKVLVTCPPMFGMIEGLRPIFERHAVEVSAPDFVQTLSVEELVELVPHHDGWIIGDDPATQEVFKAGRAGRLRAAVKWGIGVDNVDFAACKDLDIPITNTPDMCGAEVADIAMGYVIALARETFQIDDGIRTGQWPKPRGISLYGKTVALVGFGDIGKNAAKRMLAADMKVIAYDPFAGSQPELSAVERAEWPERIDEADFYSCDGLID